jgi:hypothetical protein
LKKPAEYRRHAEACRKLAVGTSSESDRARLLDMAETWTNLAAAREELLSRHPELDSSGLKTAPPDHEPSHPARHKLPTGGEGV